MKTPVIDLRNIVFAFGKRLVHEGLSLCVHEGDVVALVGGSGSGKTTLLRQIIGLETPQSGDILLFGERLTGRNRHEATALRRRFGVLFQQGALFSALDVYDNIAFPLRELKRLDEEAIYALVMHKLTQVELDEAHAWLLPAELSGGMIKRVALARALALEPELLLLDEPTAGLDPDRADAFVQLVRQLRETLGLTVLLVTHDLATLTALDAKVAVLADRRVLACDTLARIREIDHPFIRGFFRTSRNEATFAASCKET